MKLREILIWISLILLFFLVWKSCMRVDIAATKNHHLIAWKKAEIDSIQNIDSVKAYAKRELDVNRQYFKNESVRAVNSIWIILTLFAIQVYLLITRKTNAQH